MGEIVQGDKSCDIAAYKLPVVDVETQRRNFPGYTETKGLADDYFDNKYTTETRGGKK